MIGVCGLEGNEEYGVWIRRFLMVGLSLNFILKLVGNYCNFLILFLEE